MSGPVPSPSMKRMMGWSGIWSLPWLIVIFSPAEILTFPAMFIPQPSFERVQRSPTLDWPICSSVMG